MKFNENIMCLKDIKWIEQRQLRTIWEGNDKYKLYYEQEINKKCAQNRNLPEPT